MEKELKIKFDIYENVDSLDPTIQKLFAKANEARNNAYAVYSDFSVGCAVLLENGDIVVGNNQENAAYPSGLCAERTAIFWASANYPNQKIKTMFVVGAPNTTLKTNAIPPCGACRQVILEYENKQKNDIEVYFAAPNSEIYRLNSVKDLLPFSFGASYLEKE